MIVSGLDPEITGDRVTQSYREIHRIFGKWRAGSTAGNGRVIERPTAAELAVLQSLATGLSRREIGVRLYISLNTVKTHTRELYRKLGASSRADAVAHAEALGLLEPVESSG